MLKRYRVSAVIGDNRVWEFDIRAHSEKQACFYFRAPRSKGGRGRGWKAYDLRAEEECPQPSLF